MPEPDNLPPRPVRKASFFQGFMALVAPQRFGEPLVQVDLARDLAADEASTRGRTITRLRHLRRALVGSVASMASAVLVACSFEQ